MKKKEVNSVIVSIILLIFVVSISTISGDLEVKSVLLKFSVNKGDSIVKNINIYSPDGGEIKVFVRGIKKGVSIKEDNFVLDKGQEKNVEVLFDSKSIDKGVYVGHLEFKEDKGSEIIPVIFEVESKDIFFDSNLDIPLEYSEVNPNEKIVVNLKIFDLISGGTQESIGPSSINVEYNIHDLHGNIISSESENLVIDGQTSVTKTLSFPEDILIGQYVFSATIKYKDSIGTSTDLFKVSNDKQKSASSNLFDIDNFGFVFILIFMAFIFLILILFFVFMIYERNRLFLELRRYNGQELQRQKRVIKRRAKLTKKKHSKRDVKKEIKKKVKILKRIHKARVKVFKKLRKSGKTNEMRSKLQKWKREGYKMIVAEKKMKEISNGGRGKEIGKLRKKGFDTSFLNK